LNKHNHAEWHGANCHALGSAMLSSRAGMTRDPNSGKSNQTADSSDHGESSVIDEFLPDTLVAAPDNTFASVTAGSAVFSEAQRS